MFCLFQGRSDLRVQGVPAQGPGQEKLLRKFAGPPWLDGLAKGLITQHIEIEHLSRFHQCYRFLVLVTSQNTFPGVSPATVYREKSPFFGRDFSLRSAEFCWKINARPLLKKHSICSVMTGSRHLCLLKCRIRTDCDVAFGKKTSCRFGMG